MRWFSRLTLGVAVAITTTTHAISLDHHDAPLLQRHLHRILTTQADDQAACDAAFQSNPLSSYLTALPKTAGLQNCLASNLADLTTPLSAPGAKCTLNSLVALLGSSDTSTASGMAAFTEFFNALVAGLTTDPSTTTTAAPSVASILASWTTDATKNEAFCAVMNAQIGPCVEALLPALVGILDKKGACCGQLVEFYELVKLIIPDGKTLDQTLVGIVNGLHRAMCTTTDGKNAYCGQSLLSLVAGLVATTEATSLLSPLLLDAGLPLFALPDGAAACAALETTSFASRVAAGGKFSYGDLSCCVGGYASLVQSLDGVLKQLTGNTLAETLNLIANLQDASTDKQFADPYTTLASCTFKTTCTNPSFVLTEKAGSLKTAENSDKNQRPQGIKCMTTELCNKDKLCATVCEQGTATVAPWIARAVAYQRNMSYTKPLCFTQLPATHNSGTTLARGWGVRDQLMNKVLDATNSASYMRTNNQFLTLTDQLNLGVRFIELDVHYFGGKIHDGHCSRINFGFLDDASKAIKRSAEGLLSAGEASGATVEWQASLMGCLPSLGGIRADEQRFHADTVKEIGTWLKANPNDFVFVYLDVGAEVTTFKKYDEAIALHTAEYGSLLLTPADLTKADASWKTTSLGDFVKQGKRVALITGQETDSDAYFAMDSLCGGWADVPGGKTGAGAGTIWGRKTNTGSIVRVYASQLHYATMSEDAISGGTVTGTATEPATVTASTLPVFINAGVNIIAPDGLDGTMLEAMVWSWAANEPSQGDTAAEISAKDGRWYGVKDKSSIQNIACVSTSSRVSWKIVTQGASCPSGYEFGAPTLAIENAALTAALQATGADATAQLNVDVASLPVITSEDEASYNKSVSGGGGTSGTKDSSKDANQTSGTASIPTLASGSAAFIVAVATLAVAIVNVL